MAFLLDLGTNDNFTSQDLAREACIPIETLPEPKTILGLDKEVQLGSRTGPR